MSLTGKWLLFIFRRICCAHDSKKELEEYEKMCYDREHGGLLTSDCLRWICDKLNMNPKAIGKHFLEALAKMQFAGS